MALPHLKLPTTLPSRRLNRSNMHDEHTDRETDEYVSQTEAEMRDIDE